MFRFLAAGAILLNFVSLLVWGYLQPVARYERAAYETHRKASRAYNRGDLRGAVALLDHVARAYPKSLVAERASYLEGRILLRNLGRWEEAEEALRSHLERYPDSRYRALAEEHLAWIETAKDLPDTGAWELVQGMVEAEKGADAAARARFLWITEQFPGTPAAARAQEMIAQVKGKEDVR